MRPIQYADYDRLSDDVLNLGSRLYLRMNVVLSDKVDPDQRVHFHREYQYYTKYSDGKLISVKRSFSYFLSLDKVDMRSSVMIRASDMVLFKRKLAEVSTWFDDMSEHFVMKNRVLMIKNRPKPVVLEGLAAGKYLMFEPVVIVWENTGEQSPGVRITLGSPSVFADVSIDRFYGLIYTISNFNMYMSAQLLINYLGRPEFGANLREVDDDNAGHEEHSRLQGAKTARQLPKRDKSFFDKMKDMEEN